MSLSLDLFCYLKIHTGISDEGRGMFRKRSASPEPDSREAGPESLGVLSLSEKSEGGIFVMQRDCR